MIYHEVFGAEIEDIETRVRSVVAGMHATAGAKTAMLSALGMSQSDLPTESRSKRLRGLLFELVHATSGCSSVGCRSWPVVLELVHCASVTLDDIQDGHPERWGRKTLWREIGAPLAINTVFLVLAAAERVAVEDRCPRLQSLQRTILRMLDGQWCDLTAGRAPSSGIGEYLRIVRGKTCALLELAARAGSHTREREQQKQLIMYARYLGLVHQIQDDLDDLRDGSDSCHAPASNIARFVGAGTSRRPQLALALEMCNRYERYSRLCLNNAAIPQDAVTRLEQLIDVINRRAIPCRAASR